MKPHILLIIWCILMVKYICNASKCLREFDTSKSLQIHHNTCSGYQQSLVEASVRRQARAEQKSKEKKSKKADGKAQAAGAVGSAVGSGPSHRVDPPDIEMASPSHHNTPLPPTPPPPTPPPLLTQAGRPMRNYRLPARFRDILPQPAVPVVQPNPPAEANDHPIRRVLLHVRDTMQTTLNKFNVFRLYPHRPSYDPDESIKPEDLSNFARPTGSALDPNAPSPWPSPPWPFKNMSLYRLMEWRNSGSNQKSDAEIDSLVHDVLEAKDFCVDDLGPGFSSRRENQRLDDAASSVGDQRPFMKDGWAEKSVDIDVPTQDKHNPTKSFAVPGLHHRSLVEVIKTAFTGAQAHLFHLTPFKHMHVSPEKLDGNGNPIETRLFDEVYTSDAWIQAHEKLQRQPNEPGCTLEKVIAGLMAWSDSTHLASFGTAKVWPIYLYFANLSKYIRASPNSGACHHIAYLPEIPDSIEDFIAGFVKSKKQKERVLTHCRRELMQAIWRLLLDAKFMEAYEHGIIIKCADGIVRRVYPRLFTYSADYPEKVLLAGIRGIKAECVCPRCLIKKADLARMGKVSDLKARTAPRRIRTYLAAKIDTARDFIYRLGYSIGSTHVEALLKSFSLVPTVNAFAERLGKFGFDVYSMLVVDLMHEFELGVWKAIFTHIIRVLYAIKPDGTLVATLNQRFRQVPTFGYDTIRRFSNNASEMKKLAARDFEDLLQCIIPVADGLLPPAMLKMLFRLAEWHALAKLRTHTEETVEHLRSVTTVMGNEVRWFEAHTRASYTTVELPGEVAARERRKNSKEASKPAEHNKAPTKRRKERGKKAATKFLNLKTYKWHSLGDYTRTILRFGSTDSYTTQTGELAHRGVKRLYSRTNKHNAIKQIAKLEQRKRLLRRRRSYTPKKSGHSHHVGSKNDPAPYTIDPNIHHHISKSRKHHMHLFAFAHEIKDDPAKKDFIVTLREHLLTRLLGRESDGHDHTYTDAERNSVCIENNQIYFEKTLRINYTTYDMRRDQDTVNPRTHCDIMMVPSATGPDAHPFLYARVLGIFRAKVSTTLQEGTAPQDMEFLWVRWFDVVPPSQHRWGFKAAKLPKVGFVKHDKPAPFGFVNPSLVLRACHLIPAFADERTTELLPFSGPTAARPITETDDWTHYYVGIFVDRDMLMRYLGGGIGHLDQTKNNGAQDEEGLAEADAESSDSDIDIDDDDNNNILHQESAIDIADTQDGRAEHDGEESDSDSDSESDSDYEDFDGSDNESEHSDEDDYDDGSDEDLEEGEVEDLEDDGFAAL